MHLDLPIPQWQIQGSEIALDSRSSVSSIHGSGNMSILVMLLRCR